MQHTHQDDLRLAVLIDADNAPRTRIKNIMEELAVYGTPTIKRIYGDWTNPNLSTWKALLLEHAIIPIQQYGYTTGKNSTDSAMIIDAMDILYSGRVDGFCIVSSDSDFTRLATRLREAGMKVYGIGEKKTPSAFIAACDKFIYTEIFSQEEKKEKEQAKKAVETKAPEKPEAPAKKPAARQQAPQNKVPKTILKLIRQTVQDVADEDGWAFLGEVGTVMLKKRPDFDPRNFGYPKLTRLIDALGTFEIDQRPSAIPHIKHMYIRVKED